MESWCLLLTSSTAARHPCALRGEKLCNRNASLITSQERGRMDALVPLRRILQLLLTALLAMTLQAIIHMAWLNAWFQVVMCTTCYLNVLLVVRARACSVIHFRKWSASGCPRAHRSQQSQHASPPTLLTAMKACCTAHIAHSI